MTWRSLAVAASNCSELIDDVLDMAKIEAGRVALQISSFDLHALVQNTISMMLERANVKNLELVLHVSPECPRFVRSDPGKLGQVLTNLVGNAIKYTDEGQRCYALGCKPRTRLPRSIVELRCGGYGHRHCSRGSELVSSILLFKSTRQEKKVRD